jgi:hypothetical protein
MRTQCRRVPFIARSVPTDPHARGTETKTDDTAARPLNDRLSMPDSRSTGRCILRPCFKIRRTFFRFPVRSRPSASPPRGRNLRRQTQSLAAPRLANRTSKYHRQRGARSRPLRPSSHRRTAETDRRERPRTTRDDRNPRPRRLQRAPLPPRSRHRPGDADDHPREGPPDATGRGLQPTPGHPKIRCGTDAARLCSTDASVCAVFEPARSHKPRHPPHLPLQTHTLPRRSTHGTSHPPLPERPPRQRHRRAAGRPHAAERDRVGRPHRHPHRLHPLERTASRRAEAARVPRRGKNAARHHHHVHRLHRTPRRRAPRRVRSGGQGLLSDRQHPPPRQGLALPSRQRLLHRLHRLLQPHHLGTPRVSLSRGAAKECSPGRETGVYDKIEN